MFTVNVNRSQLINWCLLLVVCPTQSDMVWWDGRAMDGADAEHSPSDDDVW